MKSVLGIITQFFFSGDSFATDDKNIQSPGLTVVNIFEKEICVLRIETLNDMSRFMTGYLFFWFQILILCLSSIFNFN